MLYLAVEGYGDTAVETAHFGKGTEIKIWDAKRIYNEARSTGEFEFLTPKGEKNTQYAEDLLQLLRKWYEFRFPVHEPSLSPIQFQSGDRVLFVQGTVDAKYFKAVQDALTAGKVPPSQPNAKRKPHVVFHKGNNRVRIVVDIHCTLFVLE